MFSYRSLPADHPHLREKRSANAMEPLFTLNPGDSQTMRDERDRVDSLLRQLLPCAHISEVGSSAVDGVLGKQDIDFAVLVAEELFVETRAILDGAFERNQQQYSSDDYQGYTASSTWDVAIQLTVRGGPHDDFHAFLDALKASPALRDSYNALKRRWNGKPMQAYRDAKAQFIEAALQERGHP